MDVLTQAYRTICIPAENKIETFIPSEYNEETLAAMQEARDIMAGKIQTKKYKTAAEMHTDILSEDNVSVKRTTDDGFGYLSKYANPDLWSKEDSAWEGVNRI